VSSRGRKAATEAGVTLPPEARRNALIMQNLIAKCTQLAARLPRVLMEKGRNCAESCPLIPVCRDIADLIDEFSGVTFARPTSSPSPSEEQPSQEGG